MPTHGDLPPLPPSTHSKIRAYLRPQGGGDFGFVEGAHGTSCAGVAVGAKSADGDVPLPRGFERGAARDAKLVFADIQLGDGALYLPSSVLNLFRVAARAGVTIASHSFGSTSCDGVRDYLAYEYDLSAYENPTVTHFVAAGNCGPFGKVATPATLTLGVSVGSGGSRSAAFNGFDAAHRVVRPDLYSVAAVDEVSSVGPLADGRPAPTIVCPGIFVTAPYAVASSGPHAHYTTARGTSFAAPHAAGLGAQLVDAYYDEFGRLPRSSWVRAALVRSARPTSLLVRPAFPFMLQSAYPFGDQSYGVPLVDYEAFKSVSGRLDDATRRRAYCFVSTGGYAAVGWISPPAYPGVDDSLVNDLDLYAYDSRGLVSYDEGATLSTARVATRAGSTRVVVVLKSVTGGFQDFDAVLPSGALSPSACAACIPSDYPAACDVPHGDGSALCAWDGTTTCVVTACDVGYVATNEIDASCVPIANWGPNVTATDCAVSAGGTGKSLAGSCFVSACARGYFATSSECVCAGETICDEGVVPCVATICAADVPAPAPPHVKSSARAPCPDLALAVAVAALFVAGPA